MLLIAVGAWVLLEHAYMRMNRHADSGPQAEFRNLLQNAALWHSGINAAGKMS